MGFGIRLGPLRVGTGGAGIGLGPFYANTGFGGATNRRSSGPTKAQLRDRAVADYRWSISERPRSFLGQFDRQVDAAIGRGEAGAAAEAIVRYWIRQHGNTKPTLGWIASDASSKRARIAGEIRQYAAALERQRQSALEQAAAQAKADKQAARRIAKEQKRASKPRYKYIAWFGRAWAVAWRLAVAMVGSLLLVTLVGAVVEQLAGPWKVGEEPGWWGTLLLLCWLATGVLGWRTLRRRQSRRRPQTPSQEPAASEGPDQPSWPQPAEPAPAGPAADLGPPGWYPDPYGRFWYRYWDRAWTSTVSSNGREYEDAPD